MDDISLIRRVFSKYYNKVRFNITAINEREFGYGIRNKIDVRHLSFENETSLKHYLSEIAPLYVSYSVAYYEFPSLRPMERKNWKGSDLVFDLDYEGEKYISYPMLDEIKQETIRLIEEFIISDFGIDKKYVSINFSGNRGFHVHIFDELYKDLGGDERKELIEYIKCVGLKYEDLFSVKEVDAHVVREIGPKPDSCGYPGKFAKKVINILSSNPTLISPLFKDTSLANHFIENIKNGNWSMRKRTPRINQKLKDIFNSISLISVNIDSAVTQDKKKLIRLPNSIHGSTGLIAKSLSFNELDKFRPFKHAALTFKSPTVIQALEDIPELEFEETFEPMKKGEKRELDTALAIYFVLKKSAKFILT